MLSRGEESMKEREQRDLVYVKRDLVREVCMCDRKENLLEKRPYQKRELKRDLTFDSITHTHLGVYANAKAVLVQDLGFSVQFYHTHLGLYGNAEAVLRVFPLACFLLQLN